MNIAAYWFSDSVVIKLSGAKPILKADAPDLYNIVENLSIAPVVKQVSESHKEIPVFQQDLGNGLFKVWPEKVLEPGEYAMVQFGSDEDPSEIDLLVWDFAYIPSAH